MVFNDSITLKALGLLSAYRIFSKTYEFLKKSQYWSKDELEDYQLERLSVLLRHCYDNVPYYKQIFDERGLLPTDIQDFEDLKLLPFLTKDIIKKNLHDLKARNYPKNQFEYVTTGGTSGVPLGFYYEKRVSRAIEWAFIKTLWDRVGFKFRDKCLILKGDVVESADRGIFWKNTLFGRWLVMSSYHMTEDNLKKYIEKIRKFKPKFIQAYPSTVTILARYMDRNNIKPFNNLRAILCGSENLYPSQRQFLEEIFESRIFSWYGHSERTVLAGECEDSQNYHIFPEYGIFELVDGKDRTIDNSKELGTIVGTGLTNEIMPLIRYKTDDLTSYANNSCSCKRNYDKLTEVKGRWIQEFIIASGNRLIPITAINIHSKVFDQVEQFQFYQEKEGEVTLYLVKKENYTKKDTENIKKELLKKFGRGLELKIEFLDEIPRTSRGKHKFIIQKVPIFETFES